MTKTPRNVMAGMAIAMGTAGIPRADAAERGLVTVDAPVVMRVRMDTPALAGLIQEATERSTTFRAMVETINASDGIVYVNEGECGHGVRACLVAVTAAGHDTASRRHHCATRPSPYRGHCGALSCRSRPCVHQPNGAQR